MGMSALALALGTCCVAPWAVTLLGVGGAVLLARIAVLQPYLVAATVALLGTGFWYVYRRAPSQTGDSCSVADLRTLRAWIWGAAVAVILIDAASYAPQFLS